MGKTYRKFSEESDRPKHQQERGERYGNRRKQMAQLKVEERQQRRRLEKDDLYFEVNNDQIHDGN